MASTKLKDIASKATNRKSQRKCKYTKLKWKKNTHTTTYCVFNDAEHERRQPGTSLARSRRECYCYKHWRILVKSLILCFFLLSAVPTLERFHSGRPRLFQLPSKSSKHRGERNTKNFVQLKFESSRRAFIENNYEEPLFSPFCIAKSPSSSSNNNNTNTDLFMHTKYAMKDMRNTQKPLLLSLYLKR